MHLHIEISYIYSQACLKIPPKGESKPVVS